MTSRLSAQQRPLPDVVLLNGGSSSGKSSLARALQSTLPGVWLRLTVDDLIEACPPALVGSLVVGPGAGETAGSEEANPGGLGIGEDGRISVGAEFTEVQRHWMAGLAAMARSGARLIIEDGFLSGPMAQRQWETALAGREVVWVGVRLAPELAREREAARGDRVLGMAEAQALSIHEGIRYDHEVDTSTGTPEELARQLAEMILPAAEYETVRMKLRRFTADDAQFVLELHSNPELRRFISSAAMDTLAEAEEWISSISAQAAPARGWWCAELHDGTPVGAILLKGVRYSNGEEGTEVEIGWRWHAAHTGQGYATEAAARILRAGFESGLESIIAVVDPQNTASQAVCRRLEMEPKGTTERYYDVPLTLFSAAAPTAGH